VQLLKMGGVCIIHLAAFDSGLSMIVIGPVCRPSNLLYLRSTRARRGYNTIEEDGQLTTHSAIDDDLRSGWATFASDTARKSHINACCLYDDMDVASLPAVRVVRTLNHAIIMVREITRIIPAVD
jgi:hypothetical protein